MRGWVLVLLALCCGFARADGGAPQMARHLPWYPGLYLDLAASRDDRDASFDAAGTRRDSAETTLAAPSEFPQTRYDATFRWYFPLFESYALPLISERLYTARVNLGYADTRSDGAIAAFVDDPGDDARTDADDLRNNGSGITDIGLQFGAFLWGSDGWRESTQHPFALLMLAGATLPTGHYDRDAPVSAGSNTFSWDARLAMNWKPWPGGFVDAAYGLRNYFKNQDPAFGGLHPIDQGNDRFWDASVAQRLFSGFYATAFATGRDGASSEYEPRFAPNQPAPPSNSDNYPTPGRYRDDGTALKTVGGALSWFVTQRWLLGVHYAHPYAGRSGEFDIAYTNRSPANCNVGSLGCQTSPGATARADGMGPARVYASDRFALTLTYNFGQGDAFACTGCAY